MFRLFQLGFRPELEHYGSPSNISVLDSTRKKVDASIIVKTRTNGFGGGWPMGESHEKINGKRLFYVFVDLQPAIPVTYVVPSSVVAKAVFDSHRAWLKAPGRGGIAHHDNPLRRIANDYGFDIPGVKPGWLDKWIDRWDQLNGKAAA